MIDITEDLGFPQVLEQNDYLPFGTRIQNPELTCWMDNRWQYAGKEAQRFAPGGVFNQPSLSGSGSVDLGLLNFGARMYDPFIARWTAADPLARKYLNHSPYNYCLGSPIIHQDTDGRIVANLIGAVVGAATETGMQVASKMIAGKPFKEALREIDYADVGIAAFEGFVTAGTSAIKNTAIKTAARVAVSAATSTIAGKHDWTVEEGHSENSNLQAAVSVIVGLVAGSANFGKETVQVLKPKSNTSVVKAARASAHQRGQSFSSAEAKMVAAKNETRTAYTKATNEATSDVLNSTKNSLVELPNQLFWAIVNDDN